MRKGRDWGVILSAVGLAGAALLLGAAVTRATLRTPVTAAPVSEAVPSAESTTPQPSSVVRVASAELPGEVLSLAVERAPFDPDRQAPGQRYLMPNERLPTREPVRVERPEPPPAPDFRVLGTVAGPNGGVAVLQVEGGAPRVVAMGTEIMGYRVASIDGGRVVMSGQGRNLALEVPDAVPSAAAVANQRGQNGRAGQQGGRAGQQNTRNQNQQRETERAQQQVRDRMQQLMEQAKEAGMPVQVEMQGDRAFITGPNGQRREIQIPDGVGRVQISPQGNITFQRGRGAGGGGE